MRQNIENMFASSNLYALHMIPLLPYSTINKDLVEFIDCFIAKLYVSLSNREEV